MKYLQLLFRTTVTFSMTYETSRWWKRRIFFCQVALCTSSQSLIVLNIINLNFCPEGLRKSTKRSSHNSHRPIKIQNRTAQWHRYQAGSARATEFTWLYLSRRISYPASERNLGYPRLHAVSELRRLFTDLSLEGSGFNSRVVHVGFDVNEVASAFPRIRLHSR
jgi:hypothetical protein